MLLGSVLCQFLRSAHNGHKTDYSVAHRQFLLLLSRDLSANSVGCTF